MRGFLARYFRFRCFIRRRRIVVSRNDGRGTTRVEALMEADWWCCEDGVAAFRADCG
jgi:hypothetical protein